MSENPNPFASPGTRARRRMAWRSLAVIVGMLALISLGVFGWQSYQRQVQTADRLRQDLDEARATATRTQAEAADLIVGLKRALSSNELQVTDFRSRLASNQLRVAELEHEKEAATQTHKGLEEQMRSELESKDVTISQLQGKLTVNILDRILFDSGEAVLKSGGETVMKKIAGILAQHSTLKIHVIGHTDNVPIRASSRSRFTSNWDLSTARALAAVRYLTESAGVDPRRVGAVGYGEFRPLADNATPEGRAQNRRIAITILADELAGADTAPLVKTNAPASLPPAPAEQVAAQAQAANSP